MLLPFLTVAGTSTVLILVVGYWHPVVLAAAVLQIKNVATDYVLQDCHTVCRIDKRPISCSQEDAGSQTHMLRNQHTLIMLAL